MKAYIYNMEGLPPKKNLAVVVDSIEISRFKGLNFFGTCRSLRLRSPGTRFNEQEVSSRAGTGGRNQATEPENPSTAATLDL